MSIIRTTVYWFLLIVAGAFSVLAIVQNVYIYFEYFVSAVGVINTVFLGIISFVLSMAFGYFCVRYNSRGNPIKNYKGSLPENGKLLVIVNTISLGQFFQSCSISLGLIDFCGIEKGSDKFNELLLHVPVTFLAGLLCTYVSIAVYKESERKGQYYSC